MFNGRLKVWRQGNIVRGQLVIEAGKRGPINIDVSSPIRREYAMISGARAAVTGAAEKAKRDLLESSKYFPEENLVDPLLVAYARRLFVSLNSTSPRARARSEQKVRMLREQAEKNSKAADILYCVARCAERELRKRQGAKMMMGYTPIVVGYDYRKAFDNLKGQAQKLDNFVRLNGPEALRAANPSAFGAWLFTKNRVNGAAFQKATLQRIGLYAKRNGVGALKRNHPVGYGALVMAGKLSEIAREQRRQTMHGGPVVLGATPAFWNRISGTEEEVVRVLTNAMNMPFITPTQKALIQQQLDLRLKLSPEDRAKFDAGVAASIAKADAERKARADQGLFDDVGDLAKGVLKFAEGGVDFLASDFVQSIKPYLPALDAALPGLGTGLMAAATVAPMVSKGIDIIKKAKEGDKTAINDIKMLKQMAAAGVPEAKQSVEVMKVSQAIINKTQEAAEKEIGVVHRPLPGQASLYDAGNLKASPAFSLYRAGLELMSK